MKKFLVSLSEKLRVKKVRILVGLVLILFYLICTNSLGLLLASVICTLGAGMVLWLAIAYIIGTALSMIVDFLAGSGRQELALDEERALEMYVRKVKDKQLLRSEVKMKLIDVGWNDQLITKIIDLVYGPSPDHK